MNDQQIREIAEAAFRVRFGDVKIVRVNIRRGFDHEDDPVVDVSIIYDGMYEQLKGGGLMDVRSEIIDKVWRDAKDSPGWPHVHFIPKSEIGRRDSATVYAGPARPDDNSSAEAENVPIGGVQMSDEANISLSRPTGSIILDNPQVFDLLTSKIEDRVAVRVRERNESLRKWLIGIFTIVAIIVTTAGSLVLRKIECEITIGLYCCIDAIFCYI